MSSNKNKDYNFYEWILDGFIRYSSCKNTKEKDESGIIYSKPTYLFRGQSNSKGQYYLEPAIFREKISEHNLYEEILRKHSLDFKDMKPIEILCKMQHMGVPTRLLDLTQNPLVALFFATSNLEKEIKVNVEAVCEEYFETKNKVSPEVILFNVKDFNIVKGINSDTIKLISCLPLLKDNVRHELLVDAIMDLLAYILSYQIYLKCRFSLGKYNFDFKGYKDDFIFKLKNSMLKTVDRANHGNPLYNHSADINVNNIDKQYNFNDSYDFEFNFVNEKKSDEIVKLKINLFYNLIDNLFECKITMDNKDISKHKIPFEIIDGKIVFNNISLNGKGKLDANFLKESYCTALCLDISGEYLFPSMEQLFFQIQCNYPEFRRCANTLDLLNGSFVFPVINTDRMRSQQGVFALFGLSKYWDVIGVIDFLKSKNISEKKIIRVLIEKENLPKEIDLIELENKLFNVKRKRVDNQNIDIEDRLDFVGINKETLGCGMDTTYYSYRRNNLK